MVGTVPMQSKSSNTGPKKKRKINDTTTDKSTQSAIPLTKSQFRLALFHRI